MTSDKKTIQKNTPQSVYASSFRSHTCGELRKVDLGKRVTLIGWARLIRDHGGTIFIDLCDREGCTQIVFEPNITKNMEIVNQIGREYIIQVHGKVRSRVEGTEDPTWSTGEIEVIAEEVKIISPSKVPPFEIIEEKKRFLPAEEIRLKWKFLDLRRREMIKNLRLRHEIAKEARKFFWSHGFWEIETPYLVRSTPEGAKDFVVPVRALPGTFYSLPQSPQLYKQLLMMAGYDRYFQIARCFRDEDLREDRQPEFTQIDFEMSFVTKEEVMNLIEKLIAHLWGELLGFKQVKFQKLTYEEAIKRYGSDKPDLRFGMEIKDVTNIVKNSNYMIFKNAMKKGHKIKCICAKELFSLGFTAKSAQKYIEYVINILGGKGLTWIIVKEDKLTSIPATIAEAFDEDIQKNLIKEMKAENNDILFFAADIENKALFILGELRKKIAEDFMTEKIKDQWSFVWVFDPPYFERDFEGNVLNKPTHHPFTAPKNMSLEYLQQPKEQIYVDAYDIVINGVEIGGGSIRIHKAELQRQVFRIMGYTDQEIETRFGFLIKAMEYGAPPHGGAAIGLDRLAMIMGRGTNIRDFIAFPKTKSFMSPVDNAPTPLDEDRLQELGLIVLKEYSKERE